MNDMQETLNHAYRAANKRLFLLDYDGTLVDFKPTPPEAIPTPELIQILTRLTNDPRNTVVVVSGRPHDTLEKWLGQLPLAFAAEHGFLTKDPGQEWHPTITVSDAWKPEIYRIMKESSDRLPGSIVEEKGHAYAWHCRNADDKSLASFEQEVLATALKPIAEHHGLRVIDGSDVIEVQPQGMNKGVVAQQWINQGGWDFVLAAGDDTTDEDLLKAMPKDAFTIKVRPGESVAKMRAATPADMLAILNSLPA